MPAETDLDVRACAVCSHAATLHSNEACEAIRCDCHLTRKMLKRAAKAATVDPVLATSAAVAESAVRTRPRRRRRRRLVQSDQDVAVVA